MASRLRSKLDDPRCVPRAIAIALGVVFLLQMAGLAIHAMPGDLVLYFDYANHIKDGHVPYRDFQMEYPPLALAPILLAFVPSHIVGGFFTGFEILFAIESYLLALGAGLIVWSLMQRLLPEESLRQHQLRLGAYVVAFPLLGQLAITRFDLTPTFLTLAAVALWLRRTPRAEAGAWLVLALAVGVKLVPVIIGPLLIIDLLARRGFRAAFLHGLGFTSLLALLLLPGLALSRSGYEAAYTYQMDRGIQMESLYANALLLLSKIGRVEIVTAHAWGSFEYVSTWTAPLRTVSSLVQISLLTAVYAGFAFVRFRARDDDRHDIRLVTAVTLVLLTFVATGKVFSPQYLIWLMPFVVLLPGRLGRRTIALFLLTLVASQLIFPWFYSPLRHQAIWAALLLTARNLMIIALLGLVVTILVSLRSPRSEAAQSVEQA